MRIITTNNKKTLFKLLAILLIAIGGLFIPTLYRWLANTTIPIGDITKNYTYSTFLTKQCAENIVKQIDSLSKTDIFQYLLEYKKKNPEGIDFFIFENNHIKAWTTNDFYVDTSLLNYHQKTVWFHDVLLYVYVKNIGTKKLLTTLVLSRKYPVENDYLKDYTNPLLKLPSNYKISQSKKGIPIKTSQGNIVFYVMKEQVKVPSDIYMLSFLIEFLLGIFIFYFWGKSLSNRTQVIIWSILIIGLLLLKQFDILQHLPFEIFKPYLFSSHWFFSLGELLLWSLLVWGISVGVQKNISHNINNKQKTFLFLILYPFLSVFLIYIIRILVIDSIINVHFYDIYSLSVYSVFVLLVLLLFTIAFAHLFFAFIPYFNNKKKYLWLLAIYPIAYIFLLLFNLHIFILFFMLLLFTGLGVLFLITQKQNPATNVIGLLIASAIISGLLFYFSEKKENSIKHLLVTKLSEERDLVLENISQDIINDALKDSSIISLLQNDTLSQEQINKNLKDYLKQHYFTGYWSNYDIQITICSNNDDLEILGENRIINCFSYFNQIIKYQGEKVGSSRFYFINNDNGRISYLMVLDYAPKIYKKVFVEIDSKLLAVKQGYPELMLNYKGDSFLKKYNYAKYKNGKLYFQYGDFPYPLVDKMFVNKPNMSELSFNKYSHLIYKASDNSLFVLSSKKIGFWDIVQETSYLFLISLIFYVLLLFDKGKIKLHLLTLRGQIQITMFSLLFLFFIVVGIIVVIIIKNNFNNYYRQSLKEKMESIRDEFSEKDIASLSEREISDFVYKLSGVFYTDIHLYDTTGNLLYTSIPAIFDKNIQSSYANPNAYYMLHHKLLSRYIHQEEIGKLKFLSAYTPILNEEYKPIMYLNLPYFTKQVEMTRQMIMLITSVINIFVFLIVVSLLFTVLVSNRITEPLSIIRNHIKQLYLGSENKKIKLNIKNEIGDLVKEYNKMIDKLEESALKLAQSERESAWREMAKQVAHDIKNPLTPMKLSIQYLQQTWKKHEGKDLQNFIDKMTKTIIEQIDTITFIANEFSNFAKTPAIVFEPVKVKSNLENIISLYENEKNIFITVKYNFENDVEVCFDKHYFNRVIGNIIKNAVQSIPYSKQGIINIEVKTENNLLLIMVEDNGIGIPEDIRGKIFYPNFTTKASGTGLGLAIAKNLIEQAGGAIYFETETGRGTRFFIKFKICI